VNEIHTAPSPRPGGVPAMASLRGRGLVNKGSHDDRRQVAERGMSRAGRADSGRSQPRLDAMTTTSSSVWSRW
jgi:hypothetical protein